MTLAGVLLAGLVAGFILGFTGAGGTIVGIPCFLYLAGFSPHETFGTNALGVAIIGAALLVIRGVRKELRYGPGILFAVPGLLGAILGVQAGTLVDGGSLVFLLGFVVLLVAGYIGYVSTRPAPDTVAAPTGFSRPLAARISPIGLGVGAIAGFFGIGGGFMIVPGTSWAAKIDLKAAASAALIPITAFAALVGIRYTAAGAVSIPDAGAMALTGIVSGCVGSWLATRLPTRRFQQAFAGFLVLLGLYMIVGK